MKNKRRLKGTFWVLVMMGLLCIISVFGKTRVDRADSIQKEKQQNNCGIKSASEEDIVFGSSMETVGDEADTWRVYENSVQFEGDIPYADEEMFEILKSAYKEIEFKGEFEKGNTELYNEYKEVFWAFLQNKIPFSDNKKGEQAYIEDIYELSTYINEADNVRDYPYKYFFWDIDRDGDPELGVQNYEWGHEKFYFDYNPMTEQIVLWYEMLGSWELWIGSGKIACPWQSPKRLWFHQYKENGEEECFAYCFFRHLSEKESLYMVMMPKYAEEKKKMHISEWMKQQGAFSQAAGQWFFRVTEEQYNEIIAPYIEACEFGKEEIQKVTYTYEELFGSFETNDSMRENSRVSQIVTEPEL